MPEDSSRFGSRCPARALQVQVLKTVSLQRSWCRALIVEPVWPCGLGHLRTRNASLQRIRFAILDVRNVPGEARSRMRYRTGEEIAMETMLALVKKEAKPGLWLDEVPLPPSGSTTCSSRCCAPGFAVPMFISKPGMPGRRRRFRCRWWSATSSWARSSRRARTSRISTSARSSAARGTSSAAGAAIAWPGAGICARTPRGSASTAPVRSPNTCRCR